MQRKTWLRRLLTAALCLGALLCVTTAEATDLVIDDSGFTDPTIDHKTLYIWRRGMPEQLNESQYGLCSDILLTWEGTYYLRSTENLYNSHSKYWRMNGEVEKGDKKDFRYVGSLSEIKCSNASDAWQIMYRNGFFDYYSKDWYGWDAHGNKLCYPNAYPHGYYRWYVYNTVGSDQLTANLPFDFASLQRAGITATFTEVTKLPFAIDNRIGEGGGYLLGIRDPWSSDNNSPSSFKLMQGLSGIYSWNEDYTLSQDEQRTYIRTCLDFDSGYFVQGQGGTVKLKSNPGDLSTYIWKTNALNGKLQIYTESAEYSTQGSGSAVNDDYKYVDFYRGNPVREIGLGHSSYWFESIGNPFLKDIQGNSYRGNSPYYTEASSTFQVFWCEPTIMDFLQTDFEVQNGQASNLDGPIAIANGTTITVREGGTLTITGWVANNGTIVVENGGTLYVQDDSCLCRLNDGTHTGGGIKSSGLIIVGNNAKLCGGGVDGIQLFNGAHVVNYGLVTSENFKIQQAYTIENRGSKAVVFYGAGNGVTGSGMGTWYNPADAGGFMERGAVEATVYTDIPANAIYNY